MANPYALFPYVLLRVSGGFYDDLQRTELAQTTGLITEIVRLKCQVKELGPAISGGLYTAVAETKSVSRRQLWLAVKRNAHNQKLLPRISRQAYTELPEELRKTLRQYGRLQAKLLALEKNVEQQYSAEVRTARNAFATLLDQPNLRNGLLLSSTTIHPSLETYLSSDSDKIAVAKKERSFMEYLSRMYTKPSPFSSFTHLAVATFLLLGLPLRSKAIFSSITTCTDISPACLSDSRKCVGTCLSG
jgi:hypothetical protein